MNAQEYISSGAIEACIMGLASEQDWLELEQMAGLYPEVKAAKERVEMELEQDHLGIAMAPPTELKQRIMAALTFEKPEEETPVIALPESQKPAGKPMVVPLVPTPKPVKWLQRAVAASVILLMGSILLNFYFYSRSVTYQKQYNALVVQQNTLMAKSRAMEADFRTMKDPNMKQVVMDATPAQPGSMATVFWDTRSKDVYLMVNQLPKAASDKQYQLWAIVDGKPVSAGVVPENAESVLMKMHNIPKAQMFAITLEKKGGSDAPTLDAMYVAGKV